MGTEASRSTWYRRRSWHKTTLIKHRCLMFCYMASCVLPYDVAVRADIVVGTLYATKSCLVCWDLLGTAITSI
jgi:hypothetical protein